MSDTAYADNPGEVSAVRTVSGEGPIDFRTAARSLIDARNKDNAAAERAQAQEPAAPAPQPQQESGDEPDGAPQPEVPTETTENDPAEQQPSIEPPRSWTKDEKERFKSLPRETQEYLANREQQRDRDIRTRQNEFAEKSKALQAKEQQTEEVRKQYETALPLLLNNLQQTLAGEFADVRTMADVQKMAQDDWPRYIRWDAHQKQIAAVQQELVTAQQRQTAEEFAKFAKFGEEQDHLFVEKVPEFKNKEVADKMMAAAREVLADLGFSQEEAVQSWNGQKNFSLRDHRIQLLIKEALEARQLRAVKNQGVKNVAAKQVPPVQRPGTAGARETSVDEQIRALQKQQESATGMRAAQLGAEILKLHRQRAAGR